MLRFRRAGMPKAKHHTHNADGEGFCCNDGTLEGALAKVIWKALSRVVAKSFKDPNNYENLRFFYHPDISVFRLYHQFLR